MKLSNEELSELVKKKFSEASEMYEKKQSEGFLRLCLYGMSGTGKTRSLLHARKPVFVHQFDPSGTRLVELRSSIESRDIIVDDSYESGTGEDFGRWATEFESLYDQGFFQHVGTYCLDSLTTWSLSLMNWILQHEPVGEKITTRKKTLGIRPTAELRDYMMQQNIGIEFLIKMCGMPCDFIATAHTQVKVDQEGKELSRGLSVPGQFGDKALNIFPEKWLTIMKNTSKGDSYFYRVTPYMGYPASTKILTNEQKGTDGEVEPNIKKLLGEAGFDCSDKPNLIKKT